MASRLDLILIHFPWGSQLPCPKTQSCKQLLIWLETEGCQHLEIKLEVNPLFPSGAFICNAILANSLSAPYKRPHLQPDSCPQTKMLCNKCLLFQSFGVICYTAVDNYYSLGFDQSKYPTHDLSPPQIQGLVQGCTRTSRASQRKLQGSYRSSHSYFTGCDPRKMKGWNLQSSCASV